VGRSQFGSFDDRANRKEVMDLIKRVGGSLPELLAARQRAHILGGLLGQSDTGLAGKPVRVTPCGEVDAYRIWAMMVCGLGVPAEESAIALEEQVRKQ
jgi:hypothetical protein